MCETGLDLTKMDGIKASGANRGTHHGDYSDVPQQLLEGGAQTLAKPLHPYMDPKRQVTKALPGMHLVHKRILLSDEGRKLTECEAHMRRANQRGFKDEFLPRIKWEGAKEGYYFTTGFRGTGYYLDRDTAVPTPARVARHTAAADDDTESEVKALEHEDATLASQSSKLEKQLQKELNFDMDEDPDETVNLVNDPERAALVSDMKGALIDLQRGG